MKKNLLITLLLASTLTACGETGGGGLNVGGGTNTTADLKITYFNGGYGSDWIKNLAKRFEEKTGKTVEIVKSEEGNCGAENYIKSGYNLSDIYIAEGVLWKSLVQEGHLEDLTDVYEAEVETSTGKQKIKDFMDQGIVGNFYAQRQLKDKECKPWAMPWTAKPNAMAYNEDVLKAIKHKDTNGNVSASCILEGKWIAPPETVEDLRTFCKDCNDFSNSNDRVAFNQEHYGANYNADYAKSYAPLGWCGGVNADSLGFLVVSWWAEKQGITTSRITGEGSFADFYNFGNTVDSNDGQTFDINVWKQTGLENAYNTLADILIDSNTHDYKNTLNDPYNINLQQLQQLFVANRVAQKPVLAIASSYLENEVIKNKYIDSDEDGKNDVNFKFMNVPKLEADTEDLLYLNFSDSMIIPKKATHKDLAKEFLIFMSSEQECANFAIETNGGIRPFNCDVRKEKTGNNYTEFTNSLFDVYYNSKHVYEYPQNAPSLVGVSHIFRYAGMLYLGNLDWLTIINLLRSPASGKTAGQTISDAIIESLRRTSLDTWRKKYRLNIING